MSNKSVNKKDEKKKEEEIEEKEVICPLCTDKSEGTIVTYKIF